MVFSTSIDSSWCVDHERGKISPEICIWWSSLGPKCQAFSPRFSSMRKNFEGPSFVRKRLESDNDFYIWPKMVFSTSIVSSWCVDHEKGKMRHEICIWWSSLGPKMQAFPLTSTRWGRISRVHLLRKKVWNPRQNLIFVLTWCLARQSTALDVYITKRQDPPWDMHLVVIARSQMSGIFPSLILDEEEFRGSILCAKMFGIRERFLYLSKNGV